MAEKTVSEETKMNKPNVSKRNARATERYVNDEGPAWPADLYELGRDAVFALNMVPGQERYLKNKAFASCVERPVLRFHEARKAYIASH